MCGYEHNQLEEPAILLGGSFTVDVENTHTWTEYDECIVLYMEYHDFAVLQLVQTAALPSIEIVHGTTYNSKR